jgi:lysophospholipase L1-like esterase
MRALDDVARYDRDERWTGVLDRELGDGYEVIVEGLNGRTTVWNDPIEEHRNGKTYLLPCLDSHQPLDLVILMLGTNDLKTRHSVMPSDIALAAGLLVDKIKRYPFQAAGAPPIKVLLIAPPPLHPTMPAFLEEMFAGGHEKSLKFATYFSEVAETSGCDFLDAGEHINSSPVDGIHLEKSAHETLGKVVAAKVKEILE